MTLIHFPFSTYPKEKSDALRLLLEQTDVNPNIIVTDKSNRSALLHVLESAKGADVTKEEKRKSREEEEAEDSSGDYSGSSENEDEVPNNDYMTTEEDNREEGDALAYLQRHPAVKAFLDCPRVRSTVDEVRFAIKAGIPVPVIKSIVNKISSVSELRCVLAHDINTSTVVRIARASGVNVLVSADD